ncbi:mucoidy inhibitor MuiA family protein [Galbibacter sp. BG1]|uniref:DUF4139 domain-containing protein n=1 Tax=Galbibacter sp. BG1 TaxID=1170699 RepID=UPI0015BCE8C1|nr:DUF4139 domain-containing protein [Galbibacter sp. BG1]QLE01617.1 mucoidy inhibitor MuiA family protein [Galbibacter sp. BG1]
MTKYFLYTFLFLSSLCISQTPIDKEIATEVSAATVFLDGAQVKREKSVYLPKGTYHLKFTHLSPYVQEKSINLGAEGGNITILSINLQTSFEDDHISSDYKEIESKLKKLEEQKTLEQTHIEVIQEEIAFLKDNRNLNGKNEALSVSSLREASNYYSDKLTSLKLKEIERYKNIASLNEEITNLRNQLNEFSRKHDYNFSEILVKIENKEASQILFNLSYLVKNASWYPTYDLKATSSQNPINIVYKANVRQDTKIDWNNVALTFSSSNPNVSGTPPSLKTYYLDYNLPPPSYSEVNEVSGVVSNESGEPLPGVNIIVQNTTIGTTSDFDGRYSLSVPKNAQNLVFSYVGYQTKVKFINSETINVQLDLDYNSLDEVVVTGYGTKGNRSKASNTLQGRAAGVEIINQESQKTTPVVFTKRNTSINFKIEQPYTILSNNKNNAIEMKNNQIPAEFNYFSIPKLQEDVFLIAKITEWDKYDLLAGEANIFYENTFVGKTVLELNSQNDTLNISFGKDQNLTIKRERNKSFKSKKFLGSNKEELVGWTTTVKNNKNESIDLRVFDQVPVSNRKEIEVEIEKLSNGNLNKQTGEVMWQMNLRPGKTEKVDLNYTIKYPKDSNIYIE